MSIDDKFFLDLHSRMTAEIPLLPANQQFAAMKAILAEIDDPAVRNYSMMVCETAFNLRGESVVLNNYVNNSSTNTATNNANPHVSVNPAPQPKDSLLSSLLKSLWSGVLTVFTKGKALVGGVVFLGLTGITFCNDSPRVVAVRQRLLRIDSIVKSDSVPAAKRAVSIDSTKSPLK